MSNRMSSTLIVSALAGAIAAIAGSSGNAQEFTEAEEILTLRCGTGPVKSHEVVGYAGLGFHIHGRSI